MSLQGTPTRSVPRALATSRHICLSCSPRRCVFGAVGFWTDGDRSRNPLGCFLTKSCWLTSQLALGLPRGRVQSGTKKTPTKLQKAWESANCKNRCLTQNLSISAAHFQPILAIVIPFCQLFLCHKKFISGGMDQLWGHSLFLMGRLFRPKKKW